MNKLARNLGMGLAGLAAAVSIGYGLLSSDNKTANVSHAPDTLVLIDCLGEQVYPPFFLFKGSIDDICYNSPNRLLAFTRYTNKTDEDVSIIWYERNDDKNTELEKLTVQPGAMANNLVALPENTNCFALELNYGSKGFDYFPFCVPPVGTPPPI